MLLIENTIFITPVFFFFFFLFFFFSSLYSGAAKERHVIFVCVRCNEGWEKMGVPGHWDLSSLRLPLKPRGFSFYSWTYLVLCSTITYEHTCLCVYHANSLNVNDNPGHLLSIHRYCTGDPNCPISTCLLVLLVI